MTPMELWNKVKTPPQSALKKITGGRLSGMTDIKPQWRYQTMTEVYGLCGVGWKYEIKRLWLEPGCDNQVTAFSEIALYINVDGTWSEPIPGIGGSMLTALESKGLKTSDEAYKMATTDALSVAMRMIGVASDIYIGRWDGSKYSIDEEEAQNLVAQYRDTIKTLASRVSLDDFRAWWPANKDEIEKKCGSAGAASVYKVWVAAGKAMSKPKEAQA